MARKIYDIFPPNSRPEMRPSSEGRGEAPAFSSRPSGGRFVKWAVLVASALLAAVVSGYVFLLRVDIDIWPETEAVEYLGVIEVRADQYHYDIDGATIPGDLFTLEIGESRTFLSTGKETEDSRAEGILRVYNDHSGNPQTLVAETRFVSADGKLFRSTEAVSIPGRSGSTPGQADVRVRAVEAGEAYNIDKTSKFSIPGLQGTPMYTSVYAENLEPITGGFIGESPMITADDVETAREILISAITEEAKKKMAISAPEFIFDDETMEVTVITEFIRPGIGERYESFDYLIEAEIVNFAFKRTDLEDFLKGVLLTGLNDEGVNSMFSGKRIWDESLSFEYEADMRRMDDGVILLEVEASAIAYPVIREDLIRSEVAGMTMEEAGRALADYERIADTRIIPRPSWLKKMPSSDKIRINVRFDER